MLLSIYSTSRCPNVYCQHCYGHPGKQMPFVTTITIITTWCETLDNFTNSENRDNNRTEESYSERKMPWAIHRATPLQGDYNLNTFSDSYCPFSAFGRNNKAAFIKMRSSFYLFLKNENYMYIKYWYLWLSSCLLKPQRMQCSYVIQNCLRAHPLDYPTTWTSQTGVQTLNFEEDMVGIQQ